MPVDGVSYPDHSSDGHTSIVMKEALWGFKEVAVRFKVGELERGR